MIRRTGRDSGSAPRGCPAQPVGCVFVPSESGHIVPCMGSTSKITRSRPSRFVHSSPIRDWGSVERGVGAFKSHLALVIHRVPSKVHLQKWMVIRQLTIDKLAPTLERDEVVSVTKLSVCLSVCQSVCLSRTGSRQIVQIEMSSRLTVIFGANLT